MSCGQVWNRAGSSEKTENILRLDMQCSWIVVMVLGCNLMSVNVEAQRWPELFSPFIEEIYKSFADATVESEYFLMQARTLSNKRFLQGKLI